MRNDAESKSRWEVSREREDSFPRKGELRTSAPSIRWKQEANGAREHSERAEYIY